MKSRKLCYIHCCANDTEFSFEPVICEQCVQIKEKLKCYKTNNLNSGEFSCKGCWQFFREHHFAGDCEDCRKPIKQFRSTNSPQKNEPSDNTSYRIESGTDIGEDVCLENKSENSKDEPFANLMGEVTDPWKRNLNKIPEYQFHEEDCVSELHTLLPYFLKYSDDSFSSEL